MDGWMNRASVWLLLWMLGQAAHFPLPLASERAFSQSLCLWDN
jgi:hypothetical protein